MEFFEDVRTIGPKRSLLSNEGRRHTMTWRRRDFDRAAWFEFDFGEPTVASSNPAFSQNLFPGYGMAHAVTAARR